MTPSNDFLQVLLDKQTFGMLAVLAEKQHLPADRVAADLIRRALEMDEDMYLSEMSNERIARDPGARFSHDQAWS